MPLTAICFINPKSKNPIVKVYSAQNYEKKDLIATVNTDEKIIEVADILNNSEKLDNKVMNQSPNYILEISPVNSNNNAADYLFWIDKEQIVYQMPDLFQKSKFLVYRSTKAAEDFEKLLYTAK